MEFTKDELDTLIHFALLGQNYVIDRNNYGDREVAKELERAQSGRNCDEQGRTQRKTGAVRPV